MSDPIHAVYGHPPDGLAEVSDNAVQCSPRVPGARPLEDFVPRALMSFVVQAPPSVVERRRVLALALRSLRPGAPLTALAPNNRGGGRLAAELEAFGCSVSSRPKHHHQIVATHRPDGEIDEALLDEAIAAGAQQLVPDLGLWSEPGLFNWDRVDPGSRLLIAHLPTLDGAGCDLGCGIGVLARAVRQAGGAGSLLLVDLDRRAIEAARRNVPGDRVTTLWADVRNARALPRGLDFVVCNPPFHDGGAEDRALGQAFIRAAAGMLRPGGALWLTANRHLPYEATLRGAFATVEQVADADGYKILTARTATSAASRGAPAQPRSHGKPHSRAGR